MMGFYAYSGKGHELDEAAAWDYIHDGYLLSPRTVLKGRTKIPQTELPAVSVEPNKFSIVLQETLTANMGIVAGERRAVMCSGGFDSMLIALLARQSGAKVTAATVQFDDFNPLTIAGAIELSHQAGITHHILHVNVMEFLSAFEALAGITDEPLLDLDLAIVYAALKKYDPRVCGDTFISGMGSDQWFGNEALEADPGNFAVQLDRAMVDENAHHEVAQKFGYRFVFPFLSSPMLALSQAIPSAMKKDKKLLRALAVANMIPHRGLRSETQVPSLMRHLLIKTFGDRAWPRPVSVPSATSEVDRVLRQIVLGLWLQFKS